MMDDGDGDGDDDGDTITDVILISIHGKLYD